MEHHIGKYDIICELKKIYEENIYNHLYANEYSLLTSIKEYMCPVVNQQTSKIDIEYEYNIIPNIPQRGIGDMRIFCGIFIYIIETKVIYSSWHWGSSKTIRTSRNKKRNKVQQQAFYYANATKYDNPDHIVVPITITDQCMKIYPDVPNQCAYPWDNSYDMNLYKCVTVNTPAPTTMNP